MNCHSERNAKNPRISIAAALLFVLLGAPFIARCQSRDGWGKTSVPPGLLHRVDDHYNHLRTLRARYTERYAGMGLDRTESGTLELRKPGLMRWAYDAPPGKLFVLDGKFAWFYTPGDAQVTRAPAKQLDDLRTPLRLLLGHTQLAKELDHIAIAPAAPLSQNPATFTITGVPKAMADRLRSLTLTVTVDGAISAMKIEETTGAVTAFTFSEQKENLPLPPADFTFTPPSGLPIVNAQPPI
jgi:outer membrane lipoprotein carrier protein